MKARSGWVYLGVALAIPTYFFGFFEYSKSNLNQLARVFIEIKMEPVAKLIYQSLVLVDDPLAQNNLAVLELNKISTPTREDYLRWLRLVKKAEYGQIGAGYYNVAIRNLPWDMVPGHHVANTRRLRRAASFNDKFAIRLLSSGDEPYARIRFVASQGNVNAAWDYASSMHKKGNHNERIWALGIAAKQKDVRSMTELAFALIFDSEATDAEKTRSHQLMLEAAKLGGEAAALYISKCNGSELKNCKNPDRLNEIYWAKQLLKTPPPAPLPKYSVDANGIVRSGYRSRFYSYPHHAVSVAATKLAQWHVLGLDVSENENKALWLLDYHIPYNQKPGHFLYQHLSIGTSDVQIQSNFLREKAMRYYQGQKQNLLHIEKILPLIEKGYIRPFTVLDLKRLAKAAGLKLSGDLTKIIPSGGGTKFLILKEFKMPEGMYGGYSAEFILPPGMAEPSGDKGHNRFLRIDKSLQNNAPIFEFRTAKPKPLTTNIIRQKTSISTNLY